MRSLLLELLLIELIMKKRKRKLINELKFYLFIYFLCSWWCWLMRKWGLTVLSCVNWKTAAWNNDFESYKRVCFVFIQPLIFVFRTHHHVSFSSKIALMERRLKWGGQWSFSNCKGVCINITNYFPLIMYNWLRSSEIEAVRLISPGRLKRWTNKKKTVTYEGDVTGIR